LVGKSGALGAAFSVRKKRFFEKSAQKTFGLRALAAGLPLIATAGGD